ncbi:MAG: NGG1p interacting factor NIF3 [Candidatus Magasanikbacteria bacterium]|nr:NGG1p interacting factor NIF3 [Candidatus Magasanikbacteria bacterium]
MISLKEAYDLGLKMGKEADPRGKNRVNNFLDRVKKEYAGMSQSEQEYFDKEKLVNPYDDCRIHTGKSEVLIKRVLVGIDVGAAEVLLATQLSERGKKIDAVIAHHTIGGSKAALTGVMEMNIDRYGDNGMPIHIAEKIVADRQEEVFRSLHAHNHYQVVDVARPLGVNLMNLHTATDNLVDQFLQDFLTKKNPQTIGEVLEALLEIPEYQEAKRRGVGPVIVAGNPKSRIGRFVLEMTGGVNPAGPAYPEISRSGISTIIAMHIKEGARIKIIECNMNAVVTGHMSSDSLGMNLYLDELEKRGVEIVPCGGLIRVSRVRKK